MNNQYQAPNDQIWQQPPPLDQDNNDWNANVQVAQDNYGQQIDLQEHQTYKRPDLLIETDDNTTGGVNIVQQQ